MTNPSSAPKLPLWIFIVTDIAALVVAGFIAAYSVHPLSEAVVFTIVACIIIGATIGLVPLIVYYERQKNEMLDERQRALEALARTVAGSAEQISIAATGLHEIAEIAQKNLKHAEQLPHKLQEKIAEFQAQLANANDTEREELEKELEELRSSESERLQSTADKIARTTAEFAKLETATHQHLNTANEAVSKLAFGTANAIGKAQAAAEQALAQARQEAARVIADATGESVKTISTAKAAALTDVTAGFETTLACIREATTQLGAKIESLQAAAQALATAPAPAAPSASETAPAAPLAPTTSADPAPAAASEVTPAVATENAPEPIQAAEPPPTPKRARKPKREEPASAAETAATAQPLSPSEPSPAAPAVETAPTPTEPAAPAAAVDPAPLASEPATEAASTSADTPAAATPEAAPAVATEAATTPAPAPAEEVPEPAKPSRKRARKADDNQHALGLDIESTPATGEGETESTGVVERVLTSDGATRLIVTAYIGIGNRLFIRGNGPGLSWEKGVPLQFVSIGKWRWETNEATAPVQFRLFKNDEQECAGLGELTIDPGHQHEVTAAF